MTIFGWTSARFFSFFVNLVFTKLHQNVTMFWYKSPKNWRRLMCCLLLKSGQNCHFSTSVCKIFRGSMPPDPLGGSPFGRAGGQWPPLLWKPLQSRPSYAIVKHECSEGGWLVCLLVCKFRPLAARAWNKLEPMWALLQYILLNFFWKLLCSTSF